jgi:hypothetical protein
LNKSFFKLAIFCVYASLSIFCLNGCTQAEKKGADIGVAMDRASYERLIEKFTREDVQYDGLYNKFEVFATFLNSEVQAAILQKKSDVYMWDLKQAQAERERQLQENTTQTKFAMSFFIPSPRLNDLNKGATIWKIYLEAGGQRYEGKAMRRNKKLEDARVMFPYHNRWSVAYDVTFDVPLSGVENSNPKLILTSTVGTATLQY